MPKQREYPYQRRLRVYGVADTLHWRAKVYAWDRGIGVSAAVEELLVIGQQELKGRFEVAHPDPVVAYLWRQRVRAEGVLSREERMWLERQARRARAYKVSNGLHLRLRAYARVRRVGFSQSFETFLMLAFERLRRVGHMDLDRLVPLAMAERLDD